MDPSPPFDVIAIEPECIPAVVGDYATTTSTVEVVANVAGPVNPAG